MLRNWIIFGALLVKASFSKVEGNWFDKDFFLFADDKITFPDFAESLTFYIAFVALAWDYYLQERRYNGSNKLEMLIFALLMTGELVDYALRYSHAWFHLYAVGYKYAFSYDSFVFIVFAVTIISSSWIRMSPVQRR